MCRPLVRPIVAISVDEFDATARPSIARSRRCPRGRPCRPGRPAGWVRRPTRRRRRGRRGSGAVAAGSAVRRVARRAARVGRRSVLGAVGPTVVVRVGDPRVGTEASARSVVREPVVVGVLAAVAHARRGRSRPAADASRPSNSKRVGSPSWSGSSRSSRMPSRSVSARRGFVPASHSCRFVRRVVVGVLAAVGEPVAIGVGAASGWSATWSVSHVVGQAIAVGVRGRGRGERRQAGQHDGGHDVTRTDRRIGVMRPMVPRGRPERDPPTGPGRAAPWSGSPKHRGNASVVPRAGRPWSGSGCTDQP